jgi:hypothetical protein
MKKCQGVGKRNWMIFFNDNEDQKWGRRSFLYPLLLRWISWRGDIVMRSWCKDEATEWKSSGRTKTHPFSTKEGKFTFSNKRELLRPVIDGG